MNSELTFNKHPEWILFLFLFITLMMMCFIVFVFIPSIFDLYAPYFGNGFTTFVLGSLTCIPLLTPWSILALNVSWRLFSE